MPSLYLLLHFYKNLGIKKESWLSQTFDKSNGVRQLVDEVLKKKERWGNRTVKAVEEQVTRKRRKGSFCLSFDARSGFRLHTEWGLRRAVPSIRRRNNEEHPYGNSELRRLSLSSIPYKSGSHSVTTIHSCSSHLVSRTRLSRNTPLPLPQPPLGCPKALDEIHIYDDKTVTFSSTSI